jgi:uncharacterized protein DUF1353
MGFSDDSVVEVRETGEKDWQVLRELHYEGLRQHFDVHVGMGTDFASVPTPFVWFLPRYGKYTQAAILHDYLWRERVPAGDLTLPEADGILRRALRELGVSFLHRWIMWSAVRLGALTKPGGKKRWLRDSWQVFPFALVSLPIIGPPAILILVAQLVFHGLEWVVYLPLKLASKAKLGQKQVNEPDLCLRSA